MFEMVTAVDEMAADVVELQTLPVVRSVAPESVASLGRRTRRRSLSQPSVCLITLDGNQAATMMTITP